MQALDDDGRERSSTTMYRPRPARRTLAQFAS
jgi:hypothetical protein